MHTIEFRCWFQISATVPLNQARRDCSDMLCHSRLNFFVLWYERTQIFLESLMPYMMWWSRGSLQLIHFQLLLSHKFLLVLENAKWHLIFGLLIPSGGKSILSWDNLISNVQTLLLWRCLVHLLRRVWMNRDYVSNDRRTYFRWDQA